ncbi:MAG: hypothetical protein A2W61_07080 [Deltaproteobacteria bacterium RIFCSPLOWO2_01_44_7]|nr:MAG: hypothetical protein A2712_05580 [Deltaproteobacteria bacterium RIFCSPHIGHO2_01_FULL_43_49]OGQ14326.1 MAG: hypothetical protein A3D22_04805 [Deltaproteobacteria bacterium RIFCSPHIGHO2_02_FULL_44_53]OGQ27634.1 MAG: hypothetical protein A3D98_09370 [Deltaproteobacteria bacterium RIFCSPHIGHO2_12_FULL_44_21]OGQ30767.1 MAG: hypothetical protein A2979_01215 [Deltaproteobacteria bacterium RIFCSPLOWO2_01_FULL_45_74]OGQ41464.1 MAG: hypothetical protein A2W61_07080 [Deltaproteobacteria bacterium 
MKEAKLQQALERILRKPTQLTITDNTHVFLNAAYKKKVWKVRLHWMFLKAPKNLWHHVAQYINTHNKESSKLVDRYIEDHWHWVKHPLPEIQTKGKVYHLQKIFDSLNKRYFHGRLRSKITWGKGLTKRAYEQLQLGSFSTSRNLITVHPNLDQRFVPKHVVEATVFHEMCHAMIPVQTVNGRKQIHPPAFKKLEARYPHLRKARNWEEKNVNRLLLKYR